MLFIYLCKVHINSRLHKSKYFGSNTTRLDEKLVDIALATSAAPTYFPSHDLKHSHALVDGGICANNPAMIGLIDALSLTDRDIAKIRMISIGTGKQCHMPYDINELQNSGKIGWMLKRKKSGNFLNWLYKDTGSPLVELLMESQSNLADKQVDFMLNYDSSCKQYLRINPTLTTIIELDDEKKINDLKNLSNIDKNVYAELKKIF